VYSRAELRFIVEFILIIRQAWRNGNNTEETVANIDAETLNKVARNTLKRGVASSRRRWIFWTSAAKLFYKFFKQITILERCTLCGTLTLQSCFATTRWSWDTRSLLLRRSFFHCDPRSFLRRCVVTMASFSCCAAVCLNNGPPVPFLRHVGNYGFR
jgi:hypothetical protein